MTLRRSSRFTASRIRSRQMKWSPWPEPLSKAPWWSRYRDVAPTTLLELIDYESAASAISQFETTFVPGILQIEEYASAILRVFHGETSAPERVDALVELRTRRRELLTSEHAPKFSFVLDESVIHRLVGSPSIMRQQLENLVNVAKLPNVVIQVVPFTAGQHPGMKGPFEVVEFDDRPTKISCSSKSKTALSSVMIPKKLTVIWRPSGASQRSRLRHRIRSGCYSKPQMR